MSKPVVRLTVNLDPEVADALTELARGQGSTQTNALQKAILTAALLQKRVDNGETVLVKDAKNKLQEVRLPGSTS